MKFETHEVADRDETKLQDAALTELRELQLALVAGGTGEVVWS